jgi:hypothetical protein
MARRGRTSGAHRFPPSECSSRATPRPPHGHSHAPAGADRTRGPRGRSRRTRGQAIESRRTRHDLSPWGRTTWRVPLLVKVVTGSDSDSPSHAASQRSRPRSRLRSCSRSSICQARIQRRSPTTSWVTARRRSPGLLAAFARALVVVDLVGIFGGADGTRTRSRVA